MQNEVIEMQNEVIEMIRVCSKEEYEKIEEIRNNISYRIKDLLEIYGANRKASYEIYTSLESVVIDCTHRLPDDKERPICLGESETFVDFVKHAMFLEIESFASFTIKDKEAQNYFNRQIDNALRLVK